MLLQSFTPDLSEIGLIVGKLFSLATAAMLWAFKGSYSPIPLCGCDYESRVSTDFVTGEAYSSKSPDLSLAFT